jgi:predicted secreted hydrolase
MAGKRFIGCLAAALVLSGMVHAQAPDPALLYEELLELGADNGFVPWSGPVDIEHAAHPEARSETWLIAANLRSPEGEPVSMHVSLSRLGVRPEVETAFDLRALYRGHVIVTFIDAYPLAEERFSRGLGAAGEDAQSVWIDDWSLKSDGLGSLSLGLVVDGSTLSVALQIRPDEGRVLVETDGAPFVGYSLPGVPVTVEFDGQRLTGSGWFDHFWGDVPLPGGPVTYDRLVVHLDDGSAVSLVRTRRQDGQGVSTLDGALFDTSGALVALSDENVELTETRLAGAGLVLELEPLETNVPSFVVPTVTTLLRVTGSRNGSAVTGIGTMQDSDGLE